MRYLTTRDIFLSTINKEIQINEVFTNDITFGGSLLGRLVNSIIRKGKIKINYKKVEPIAEEIEGELNKLLFSTIRKEEQEKARTIITKALLEEIYNTVISDAKELDKINSLLDKSNNDGLITLAIKYIKASPADADYGKGDRDTLISQLEKFKSELEALKVELTKGSEADEEDVDAEEKDIEKIILSKLFKGLRNIKPHLPSIKDLSKSNDKVEIVKFGQQLMVNKSTIGKPLTYDQLIKEDMIFNDAAKAVSLFSRLIIPLNSSDFINYEKNNPIFKQIEQFISEFGQAYAKMVNMYDSKTKPTTKVPNDNVNASYLFLKYSEFIIEDKEQGASVGKQYPAPAKQETGLTTTNKNKEIALNQETGLVTTDKSKKTGLVTTNKSKETGLVTTDKPEIKKQEITAEPATAEQDEFYNLTIKLLKETLSICYTLLKTQEPKGDFNTTKKEKKKINVENASFSFFTKYGKIYEDDNVTPDDPKNNLTNGNTPDKIQSAKEKTGDKVQVAWFNNFKTGEENEWRLNMDQANKVAADIDKNTKPLTDDELKEKIKNDKTKDSILRISDLFGKAYRCYATGTIPSGRPGDRISGKTFREYKYIGKGIAPVPSETAGPGYGPWANIKVYNNFTDKISDLIANTKYRKIFNAGAIKTTGGVTTKGNVLLEFIRNMIDENELKSYEANRAKLLNKYFGLQITEKEDTGVPDPEKDKTKGKRIYWNEIYGDAVNKNIEPNTFIAISCNDKSSQHQSIVGHILKKKDNKILIKFQMGNEKIPLSYGFDINPDDRWSKKEDSKAAVYIGLIDLNKTPLVDGTKFKIAWRKVDETAVDKKKTDTQYEIHYYTPMGKLKPSGKVARQDNKKPIAILVSDNDKGERIPLKSANYFMPAKMKCDIKIDTDLEFNNADNKLQTG